MTIEETRQLGIEFERRVQTMIPEKEFLDKLDTETIYSFLNQYQDKYVNEIYRSLDNIPSGSKLSARVDAILESLLTDYEVRKDEDDVWRFGDEFPIQFTEGNSAAFRDDDESLPRSITLDLPTDFSMYLRSISKVLSTYRFKNTNKVNSVVSNQLISQNDASKCVEQLNNNLRILRHPIIILNRKDGKRSMTLIHDRYTDIYGIKLVYYKHPQPFSILKSKVCELPMEAFDDLVSGAVDLYVQYVAGAEARKRQQDEARKKQAEKKEDDDNKES